MSQPESLHIRLEPEDNQRLANLCGQFDEHLRQIERRLGIEINNRGSQFHILGPREPVRVAGSLLEELYSETEKSILQPK